MGSGERETRCLAEARLGGLSLESGERETRETRETRCLAEARLGGLSLESGEQETRETRESQRLADARLGGLSLESGERETRESQCLANARLGGLSSGSGERLGRAFGDLEPEVLLDQENMDLRGRKGGGSSAGSIAGVEGSGEADGIARNMWAGARAQ